jgi:hypothetical protein
MTAALSVVVVGAVLLALAVDVAVIVGWLRRLIWKRKVT